MKILAIYRHYWPDATPYARILRLILEHLAARGHDVAVYTAQPSYNDIRQPRQPWRETLGGVQVRRIRLLPERKRFPLFRAVNFAYFLVRAAVHAMVGRRYDLVIANSHPPVAMGCVLRWIHKLKGTPYVVHCQDIHPESAMLAGKLRRGLVFRWLRRLDSAACRDAQKVVVLSQDMLESLATRGLPIDNVVTINNPPLPGEHAGRVQLPAEFEGEPGRVRLLFAGNLGHFQGLDRLIEAMRQLSDSVPAQLILMGEGAAKQALIEQAGELVGKQVVFVPHQPVETALAAIRASDYGIVSLLPDVYRYAFPSKSMMYLSAGCPLVAVIEPDSELARTVRDHDLGYVAANRSVEDLAEAIATAATERGRWTPSRRQEIAQFASRLYGRDRMLAAWDLIVPPAQSAATGGGRPEGGGTAVRQRHSCRVTR